MTAPEGVLASGGAAYIPAWLMEVAWVKDEQTGGWCPVSSSSTAPAGTLVQGSGHWMSLLSDGLDEWTLLGTLS